MSVENIARKRAENDCRKWTARDMLVQLVNDIDLGHINPSKIVVHWLQEAKDGTSLYGASAAGINVTEHIALLNVGIKKVVEDWID